MKKKYLVIIFASIQVLIITIMIVKSLFPLVTGKPVIMLIEARDPRDIFRGDYVVLNYSFNSINFEDDSINNYLDTTKQYKYGDNVFIELEKRDKYYFPISIYDKMPDDSKIYMKSTIQSDYTVSTNHYNYISLKSGIESYYTNSEQAKELENYMLSINSDREKKLEIVIMIADNGSCRIKEIRKIEN